MCIGIKKMTPSNHQGQLILKEARTSEEWAYVRKQRQETFFEPAGMEDPYTWTFEHASHKHFLLQGNDAFLGYAHVQLWPDRRAALRIIVVEDARRRQGLGALFLRLCEEQVASMGYTHLHTESSPRALPFYGACGYKVAPFNDPDGYESDPSDTPLVNVLTRL